MGGKLEIILSIPFRGDDTTKDHVTEKKFAKYKVCPGAQEWTNVVV